MLLIPLWHGRVLNYAPCPVTVRDYSHICSVPLGEGWYGAMCPASISAEGVAHVHSYLVSVVCSRKRTNPQSKGKCSCICAASLSLEGIHTCPQCPLMAGGCSHMRTAALHGLRVFLNVLNPPQRGSTFPHMPRPPRRGSLSLIWRDTLLVGGCSCISIAPPRGGRVFTRVLNPHLSR